MVAELAAQAAGCPCDKAEFQSRLGSGHSSAVARTNAADKVGVTAGQLIPSR